MLESSVAALESELVIVTTKANEADELHQVRLIKNRKKNKQYYFNFVQIQKNCFVLAIENWKTKRVGCETTRRDVVRVVGRERRGAE